MRLDAQWDHNSLKGAVTVFRVACGGFCAGDWKLLRLGFANKGCLNCLARVVMQKRWHVTTTRRHMAVAVECRM